MKHAYLIIAHNEFEVLRLLISALDDSNNDIYVHIDKKVKNLPKLQTSKSKLFVLNKRIDVRWGHNSQIKTEMLLFETALENSPYKYYHLISGTHLPLAPQEEICRFFEESNAAAVFSALTKDTEYQEALKMHRINIFLRNYASRNKFLASTSQFLWKSFIAVQRVLHITVNNRIDFYKAANWVSLNEDAVRYLVERERHILKTFRYTLCGDEFFVPTELMSSHFKDGIVNSDKLLKQEMQRANPRTYSISELNELKKSGYLFARKFTTK